MTKIVAVGGKKDLPAIVDTLYELKAVHIKEHTPGELDIGSPQEHAHDISEALIKADAILTLWKQQPGTSKQHTDTTAKTLKNINTIHTLVQEQEEAHRTLQAQASELKQEVHTHKILSKLGLKHAYTQLESVTVLFGTVKDKAILKGYESQTHTELKATYAAVAVPKEEAAQALQELQSQGFSELPLPASSDEKALNKEFKTVVAAKREAEQALEKSKKEHGVYIANAIAFLEEEAEKAAIPLSFAASENIFYVTGFVPTENWLVVKQEIEKAAKNRAYVLTLEEDQELEVPILMDQPPIVRSFQFFPNLYALPRYKEIDPVFFTFLTFPLLFGFMLGDMGYGLITLVLFFALKKFKPQLAGFSDIIIVSSLWTIVWGFFFGKAFGASSLFGFELWRVLHRLYDVMEVLYLSLAIGVLHINFGLAVGFINEYKRHGLRAAIFEKASWWVLQLGILVIALPFVARSLTPPAAGGAYWLFEPVVALAQLLSPLQPFIGYALLAAGIVMIAIGEGITGIVELPAILSNVLSYARMFAIGMAKASLAVVINTFAGGFMLSMGWWGLIPTTLLLVFGHGINIMLGLLGGFLHSLRLHYVEFYSRFYKGGGKRYQPFGTK